MLQPIHCLQSREGLHVYNAYTTVLLLQVLKPKAFITKVYLHVKYLLIFFLTYEQLPTWRGRGALTITKAVTGMPLQHPSEMFYC